MTAVEETHFQLSYISCKSYTRRWDGWIVPSGGSRTLCAADMTGMRRLIPHLKHDLEGIRSRNPTNNTVSMP